MLVDDLATMISGSAGVLAFASNRASPFTEVVLWVSDGSNPGNVDPGELAVLSHSRAMQAIRVYMVPACDDAGGPRPVGSADPAQMPVLHHLTEFALAGDRVAAGFRDAWRSHPAVRAQLLATGVSDLVVELANCTNGGGQALRIEVIWASDSADGEESVVAHAPLPRTAHAKEFAR